MPSIDAPPPNEGQVAKRYSELEAIREIYLTRAREAAKLTIPFLIAPVGGYQASITYPTPYQSIGARGTNNLASNLLLTLLPPNSPIHREMVLDSPTLQKMAQDPEFKSTLEKALGHIEQEVVKYIETSNARISCFEGFKHILVAGNVLLHVEKKFAIRVFPLDRYVVKRAPGGKVLEIIVKECVAPVTLPMNIQVACGLVNEDSETKDVKVEKTVDLYTYIRLEDGKKIYKVHQEIKGVTVPDSEGSYPEDVCPWIALRHSKMDGEDYGRGFVEEYIGDLKSLEGLSQAIVEAAGIMAKMVPLVKPGGTVRIRDLTGKANGEPIVGDPEDVAFLQVQKHGDLSIPFQLSQEIKQRLEQAFLLTSSAVRQAERLTAEEFRTMVGDLEKSHGGLYSIFAQEFQLPLVRIAKAQLMKEGRLPKLPDGAVQPVIITGLEALGRGQDLNKLSIFIQGASQDLGPGVLPQYLNTGEYLRRRATSLGIDEEGLIKSEEEVQAYMQQQQQMALAAKLGPQAISAYGAHETQKMRLAHEAQAQESADAGQSA